MAIFNIDYKALRRAYSSGAAKRAALQPALFFLCGM